MKVSYDPKADTLSVILRENVAIAESDEDKPGVILDYDGEGIWSHSKSSMRRRA